MGPKSSLAMGELKAPVQHLHHCPPWVLREREELAREPLSLGGTSAAECQVEPGSARQSPNTAAKEMACLLEEDFTEPKNGGGQAVPSRKLEDATVGEANIFSSPNLVLSCPHWPSVQLAAPFPYCSLQTLIASERHLNCG